MRREEGVERQGMELEKERNEGDVGVEGRGGDWGKASPTG